MNGVDNRSLIFNPDNIAFLLFPLCCSLTFETPPVSSEGKSPIQVTVSVSNVELALLLTLAFFGETFYTQSE